MPHEHECEDCRRFTGEGDIYADRWLCDSCAGKAGHFDDDGTALTYTLDEPEGQASRIPRCDLGNPEQLSAFHGNFGHFDHWRKHVLSACWLSLRGAATLAGEKKTDKQLDAEAHCHPNYVFFLTDHLQARIAYERMLRENAGV